MRGKCAGSAFNHSGKLFIQLWWTIRRAGTVIVGTILHLFRFKCVYCVAGAQ